MADIQVVKFVKGLKHIHWKKSFEDDLNSSAFLQHKISKMIDHRECFPSYDESLGLLPAKIDDIVSKLLWIQTEESFG